MKPVINHNIYLDILFFFLYFTAAICLAIYRDFFIQNTTIHISLFSSMLMAFTICMLCYTSPRGVWSISIIYIIVFALFHFGIVVVVAFGAEVFGKLIFDLGDWIYSYSFKYAIVLITVGLIAYATGVHFARLLRKKIAASVGDIGNRNNENYAKAGFWLILVSFFYWLLIVVKSGGIGLLLSSYSEFRDTTRGSSLGFSYFFCGLGLLFIVVSESSKLKRFGIIIFIIFAIFALSLGLRGEVLFPVFASLAIISMKKVPMSPRKVIILGVCLLSLIAVIKQVRQVGVGRASLTEISFNPTNGLVEMGGSIRPVVEVLRWAEMGDDFIYGASYWAPFDRGLVWIVPGWTRPPAADDDRLLGLLAQKRSGSIGFSLIAEAYRNFGVFGVFMFMFLIGNLFGRMDLLEGTQINQLKAGIIILPLMIQVRNSFIFVPFSIGIGFLILYCVNKISVMSAKNQIKKYNKV